MHSSSHISFAPTLERNSFNTHTVIPNAPQVRTFAYLQRVEFSPRLSPPISFSRKLISFFDRTNAKKPKVKIAFNDLLCKMFCKLSQSTGVAFSFDSVSSYSVIIARISTFATSYGKVIAEDDGFSRNAQTRKMHVHTVTYVTNHRQFEMIRL